MGTSMKGTLRYFRAAALLAVVLVLAVPAGGALAQEQTQDAVTLQDLESLVATIKDDSKREELVSQLNALIELKKNQQAQQVEQQSLGGIIIEQISVHSEALGRQLSALADALLRIPDGLGALRDGLSDPKVLARWTQLLLSLIAVVAAGFVVQSIVRKLLARPLSAITWREGEGPLMRLFLLAARLLLILVPPVAFAAVGGILVSLFGAESVVRSVTLALIYAVATLGAINAVSRTILAPAASAIRPVRLTDETAQYLHIWVVRVSVVGIFGYFGIQVAAYLGLAGPAQIFLHKLIALLMALLAVMLVLQNRRSVAHFIAGGDGARMRPLRRRLAEIWHVLAILYVTTVYLVWVIGLPGGFAYIARATLLSALAILVGLAATGFAMRLIDRGFALSDELKGRLPGLEERVNRYLPIIKSILKGVIGLISFLAVLQAWGIDILSWLSEPAGELLVSRLASIGSIILLAIVAWEALSAVIERYLASEDGSKSQRVRTLLPLIRKVVLAVLSVVVGLTVLSELGIEIAPLLAGAGVVGLAVGFGAQTLVRDIITGLFILIEDTISVGDFVALGGHEGTVEALSIRTIRLRDPSGTVHTIPFSDVTAVVNYTREFAYAVLEIGVAYKEDVDRVIEVVEEVGHELRNDPDQQANVLDDLQVLGLDRFDDSAVVIKARIKAVPGMQWAIRRAYNRLLKRRFDAEGIEIPFPQRTVWFAEEPPADEAVPDDKKNAQPKRKRPIMAAPSEGDLDTQN
jgi:small conductance mechanosensitive channel